MEEPRQASIRKPSETKLMATFVVFALVLGVIIAAQIHWSRVQQVAEVKKTLLNYSSIADQMLSASLQRVDDAVLGMAIELGDNPQLMNKDYISQMLRALHVHRDIPGLSFRVINAQGQSVVGTADLSVGPPDRNVNYADRPHFKSLKAGAESNLSPPMLSRTRDQWQIVLARRLTAGDGRFLGMVAAALDVDYFSKIRGVFHLGQDDNFVIFAGDEPRMVARFPKIDGVIGSPFKYHHNLEPVVRGVVRSGAYDGVSPFDGKSRFVSIVRLEKFPVYIIVGRSMNAQLATWTKESAISVVVYLLAVSLGALVIWRFIRNSRILSEQQVMLVGRSKMALLGEMASGIAHEINNPLAIILGRIYQLRRMVKNGNMDPEAIGALAENIESTTMRMSQITRGLKFFARDGQSDPFRVASLKSILDETLGLCRARFQHYNIELRLPIIADDLVLECRSVQISQLLLNLLSNAFDAVEGQKDKWIAIEVHELGGQVEIAVSDNGSGINSLIAEKIMQPFFTTKEPGKGTGLGLSISKGIVDAHRGQFFVDAGVPHTRFVVRLPRLQVSDSTGVRPAGRMKASFDSSPIH